MIIFKIFLLKWVGMSNFAGVLIPYSLLKKTDN